MLRRLGGSASALLGLITLASGCTSSPSYAVVVEGAELVPAEVDARAACDDASSPRVFVAVRAPHAASRTSLSAPSSAPSWDEAVLTGHASTLATGLRIEVLGVCEADSPTPFLLGATVAAPSPRNFQGYPLVLERFGAVDRVVLRFVKGAAPVVSSGGDCDLLGCYDDGGGYDEGGYWDSVEDGSGWDDGSYDDGDWDDDDWDDDDWDDDGDYDDGSYDDGDYDDGSYDDGDYDDGSYDDDSGDW